MTSKITEGEIMNQMPTKGYLRKGLMCSYTKSGMSRVLVLCTLGVLFALAVPASAQDNTDYTKPYLTKRFPLSLMYPGGYGRNRQLMNLKNMTLAAMEYYQEKNNIYPDMRNSGTVQKALLPFRQKNATFFDPITKLPYLPNPFLSHKSANSVHDPNMMILFYEARPASDGTRGVAFADGHAAAVLEREWPRLKRMSHML
jgi:prepilin-type processing-associated H-X9-DG protein